MVHPNVLTNSGVDPEKYRGFGFGAAIDFLRKIGFESVAKRDLELGKKAFDASSNH
jgi:phenylalanyl-tRNA synthetase alpha subunit